MNAPEVAAIIGGAIGTSVVAAVAMGKFIAWSKKDPPREGTGRESN